MTCSSRRAGASRGWRRRATERDRLQNVHQKFIKKLGEQYEKEMVLHRSARNPGNATICIHRRRNSVAPVELAIAAAVRLAPDSLLASAWTSGAVPDPLRRLSLARFTTLQLPPAHGRALQAKDARRARTNPAARTRILRLRPIRLREQSAMSRFDNVERQWAILA